MRVVLDTNVVVSAVLRRDSPPDSILRSLRKGLFELVMSDALLGELSDVLARPRIAGRLPWSAEDRTAFVAGLGDIALLVAPERLLSVATDSADNRVLEAAVEGAADYIVTGDGGLLAIGRHEGIEIVTPARFVAILVSGIA